MAETIHNRVLTAKLHVGVWSGRKHDKKVTEEVAINHSAERDAGRYSKQLIASSALKNVSNTHSLARQTHYQRTLPWTDDGTRIIASTAYQKYTEAMQKCKHAFYAAVEDFIDNYDDHVKASKQRLGSLYDPDEFPTVDELKGKFSFDVEVSPLPRSDDIRIDITEKEIKSIAADIERRTNERINKAVRSVYERIHIVVGKMYEGLDQYQVKGSDKKRLFRDSLVFNVHDVADLLSELNITGDPNIEKLQKEIYKDLCNYAPEELRAHDDKRIETKKKAKSILDKVSQYMA